MGPLFSVLFFGISISSTLNAQPCSSALSDELREPALSRMANDVNRQRRESEAFMLELHEKLLPIIRKLDKNGKNELRIYETISSVPRLHLDSVGWGPFRSIHVRDHLVLEDNVSPAAETIRDFCKSEKLSCILFRKQRYRGTNFLYVSNYTLAGRVLAESFSYRATDQDFVLLSAPMYDQIPHRTHILIHW
jgi:hypothetical protein